MTHQTKRNTTEVAAPAARPRGFALIITISMMILLSLLAVGLLSLSSISLRASSSSEAMNLARSNARLALHLAIGELQKTLGPDQRISAPASLVDNTSSQGITGSWESWAPNPEGGNDYEQRRSAGKSTDGPDGEFVGWLVSNKDGGLPDDPAKPPTTDKGITMVSEVDQHDAVKLETVQVGEKGSMAWMVMDEGVKARFNLPYEENTEQELVASRLRAPRRDAAEFAPGLEQMKFEADLAAKTISNAQGELATESKNLRDFVHDFTPYSASIMSNVVAGGLKGDLTRAFESAPSSLEIPDELASKRIYSQEDKPLSQSDPYMTSLAHYYQLHRQIKDHTTPIQATGPKRFYAYTGRAPNIKPNAEPIEEGLITPVISKVQVVFSLVSREAHAHWINTIPNKTGDPKRKYMVYMIYTPVVTVSNPYDVPIQFSNLKTTFRNLPIAFQFFRSGRPQTNNMFLLSQTHISSQNTQGHDDPFSITAGNAPGSSSDKMITLNPGEARVFGVNHPTGTRWGQMTNYLWQNDLDTSKTLNITAGPGWDFRSGFIVDWLAPKGAGQSPDNKTLGVFGVRSTDNIDVACAPMMPSGSNGEFSVEVEATIAGSRSSKSRIAYYNYKYGDQKRLYEILENGQNPLLGSVEYPFRRERPWSLLDIYQPAITTTPVEDWTGPQQFAMFTLADRTAQDSQYPGKPIEQSSFVHPTLDMDATKAHPAQMPMEVSLLPIRGGGANTVGSIDADEHDRAYFFSGNRLLTGALNVPTYHLPATPPVNLADFRHANLANNGRLPLVSYTVGESIAPALLPPDAVRSDSEFGYEVLDHAWLANHSLWDNYYLSAVIDENEARNFFEEGELKHNPRFLPYLPAGSTDEEAIRELNEEEGWKRTAAHQLLRGGFNVNSTSKEAWIAILSAHSESEIPQLEPNQLSQSTVTSDRLPVLRTPSPVAGPINMNPDNQTRWGGFRDLSEGEVELLAEKIVEEVREKGPFLSMSDFLNRRLVPAEDTASQGGALELAIRNAGINSITPETVRREITAESAREFGFANPEAASGDTESGSPANITQGDLLSMIGSSLTVRSDTFTIRGYGEALDSSGDKVLAKAWCEAVVQRTPEFVDPTDDPDSAIGALSLDGDATTDLTEANRKYGRRMTVVSFRWLSAEEI